jgi:hypothetical protein
LQTSLKAQAALQITSPANGASVEPGQTLNITVAASGGTFRMVAVWGTNPLGTSQVLATPPYNFSILVPTRIPLGAYYLTAIGGTAGREQVLKHNICLSLAQHSDGVHLWHGYGYGRGFDLYHR